MYMYFSKKRLLQTNEETSYKTPKLPFFLFYKVNTSFIKEKEALPEHTWCIQGAKKIQNEKKAKRMNAQKYNKELVKAQGIQKF